ncbi:11215_t:CDS:2, partial [Entrophospora sp. SA101]
KMPKKEQTNKRKLEKFKVKAKDTFHLNYRKKGEKIDLENVEINKCIITE